MIRSYVFPRRFSPYIFSAFLWCAIPTAFGAPEPAPGDSPMFRNDPAHSGIYSAAGAPRFSKVKWSFRAGGEVISSPAIVGGIVYVGSNDGNLYAVDQEAGSQKWK